MKKICILLVSCFIFLDLSACDSQQPKENANNQNTGKYKPEINPNPKYFLELLINQQDFMRQQYKRSWNVIENFLQEILMSLFLMNHIVQYITNGKMFSHILMLYRLDLQQPQLT